VLRVASGLPGVKRKAWTFKFPYMDTLSFMELKWQLVFAGHVYLAINNFWLRQLQSNTVKLETSANARVERQPVAIQTCRSVVNCEGLWHSFKSASPE